MNNPSKDPHPVPEPGQQPELEPEQNQGVVQNVWSFVQYIFSIPQSMLVVGNEEAIQEIIP